MTNNIIDSVGKKLYKTEILKEYKRYLVFKVRCKLHKKEIDDLLRFFEVTPLRENILENTPSLLEQTTRSFFYNKSTYLERVNIVKNHISYLENMCNDEFLDILYVQNKRITLWEDIYDEKPIHMDLWFHGGQRKEGCLSLTLTLADEDLYQIMFWISPNSEGKMCLWIGAIQGSQNNNDLIKALTKHFFGYRTKNLIFYGIRNLARCLKLEKIYAVTNAGYYAMNHIRMDRKLKVVFEDFWQECEGEPCSDNRFYAMPLAEYRKDMSELKPSKRAQHRRRFEKLDEIDASFKVNLEKFLRLYTTSIIFLLK